MRRISIKPRKNWRSIVESQGLLEPDVLTDGSRGVYWVENAYYELTSDELKKISAAAEELHQMYMVAIDDIISKDEISFYGVPSWASKLIRESWYSREPMLLGRFDFCLYNGQLKVFEYNALPTSLMEATAIQGGWLEQQRHLLPPGVYQANHMEGMLVDRWRYIADFYSVKELCISALVRYISDTTTGVVIKRSAEAAGLKVVLASIDKIDYDPIKDRLIDALGRPIHLWYKLYPWEWLVEESAASLLTPERVNIVEPWWKFFISNKKILLKLWQLFPGHPLLLETSLEPIPYRSPGIVKKAIHGREGSNIHIKLDNLELETPGNFAGSGYIYQEAAPLPCFNGNYALIGAWMVGDRFAGIGLREDDSPITGSRGRFVPHVVVD